MLEFLNSFIKGSVIVIDLGLAIICMRLLKDSKKGCVSESGLVIFTYVLLLNAVLLIFN